VPDEPDSDRSDDRWGRATSVKFDDTAEDADKGGGKLPGEAETVPPASECLRTGIMCKKSMDTKGVAFEERYLALVEDRLLISKVDDPSRQICDYVLLKDVVECEFKEEDEIEAANRDDPTTVMLEVIIRTTEEV